MLKPFVQDSCRFILGEPADEWQTQQSQAAMVFLEQEETSELGLQVGEEHAGLALEVRERTNGRAREMDSERYEDRAGAPGH